MHIVQFSEVVRADWLDRSMLEPRLERTEDGEWQISVHRQGVYSTFEVPYIASEVILEDQELGLVVVLVGYHGSETEKYGRLGYMTQKGQFYRYYHRQQTGEWQQVKWRQFNDELRQEILALPKPEWARSPGKLASERKVPVKGNTATLIAYKVVRLIEGRYYSLFKPEQEYILGQKFKDVANKRHHRGFYTYLWQEAQKYLEKCALDIPFDTEATTPAVALLECQISGKIIDYGHKMASTYLLPQRVLEVRDVQSYLLRQGLQELAEK